MFLVLSSLCCRHALCPPAVALPPARSGTDASYPKDFKKTAMTIFKRLFRVFAIIYCSHFDNIEQLGAAAHLNTSFKVLVLACGAACVSMWLVGDNFQPAQR